MKITISIKHLLLGILFLTLAYFTATGVIQTIIPFAGSKNEFAFLGLTSLVGFLLIVFSFEKFTTK
jgi:hypothetical protein